MAGMNDIKARIKSVESTMQITKAMELVATSKLRRAKETVERTRPYTKVLSEAMTDIISGSESFESEWFMKGKSERTLIIVFAGDRGLAGGYNSNVSKTAEANKAKNTVWLPVGKKAVEYMKHRGYEILTEAFYEADDVGVGSAMVAGEMAADGFITGKYGRVLVIYTEFVSMMTQKVVCEELLPLKRTATAEPKDISTDGDPDEMLSSIVPSYIGGLLYSALCESIASEMGARRAAMNSANKNAEEIIGTLTLSYNRARQAAITQEITEIVSGAEAL